MGIFYYFGCDYILQIISWNDQILFFIFWSWLNWNFHFLLKAFLKFHCLNVNLLKSIIGQLFCIFKNQFLLPSSLPSPTFPVVIVHQRLFLKASSFHFNRTAFRLNRNKTTGVTIIPSGLIGILSRLFHTNFIALIK